MGLGALGRAGQGSDPARGRCSPAEGSEVSGAAGSLRLLGRAHGQALIRVPKCALGSPQDPHHRSPWCPNVGHELGVPHRAPCTPSLQQPGAGLGVSKSPGGVWCSRAGSRGVPKSQIPAPGAHPSPAHVTSSLQGPDVHAGPPPGAALAAPEQQSASGGQRCSPQGCAHPLGGAVLCTAPFSLAHTTPSQSTGWERGLQTQLHGSSAAPSPCLRPVVLPWPGGDVSAAALSSWGCSAGRYHGVPPKHGRFGAVWVLGTAQLPAGACTQVSSCPPQTRQSLPGVLPTRQQVSGLPVCA